MPLLPKRAATPFNKRPPARISVPKPGDPGSKIGPVAGITDRNIAMAQPIESQTGAGYTHAQFYTYFTRPNTASDVLYPGDNNWATVTLLLETAGPVAVGQLANLRPVLSGKGMLLQQGASQKFLIAKGVKLYIASTSVNRVKVSIEPIAWAEQITALVAGVVTLAGGK